MSLRLTIRCPPDRVKSMSKREIIRCLKRYLARELFRLLPAPDAIAKPVNGELEIAA